MAEIIKLIQQNGEVTVVIALLIFIILWFMKTTSKLINSIDNRLDKMEQSIASTAANNTVITEFMKAFLIKPSNPNKSDNKEVD